MNNTVWNISLSGIGSIRDVLGIVITKHQLFVCSYGLLVRDI
jgi:hypothetical protein